MNATWWAQASPGTTYWRCEVPARHLPGQVLHLGPTDLAPGETDDEVTFPRQNTDVAIWQFAGNATRGIIMAGMQDAGHRVFLEVDDDYTKSIPWLGDMDALADQVGDTWRKTLPAPGTFDAHSIEAHKRIIPWVDGVITATPYLGEVYSEFNDNVFVCRNSVDAADWNYPQEEHETLRIVWAASESHHVDEFLVRRAMEWAVRQPNVEVYLVGYQPPWRGDFKRVEWIESVEDYRREMRRINPDIGVCPLHPTLWANSKSDVKALEYAICGAAPVVSRVESYSDWRDRVPNCSIPKDWERTIRDLVAHPDDVAELAASAHEYVMSERLIEHEIDSWRAVCGSQ